MHSFNAIRLSLKSQKISFQKNNQFSSKIELLIKMHEHEIEVEIEAENEIEQHEDEKFVKKTIHESER